MSTADRLSRRKTKKRANTLDPSSDAFRESARLALSSTPSPSTDSSKRLKPKANTTRVAKSKSPSVSTKSLHAASKQFPRQQIKAKKAKTSRQRSGSDANVLAIKLQSSADDDKSMSSMLKKKKKKKQKQGSQTPANDFVGYSAKSDDDPFGVKKKRKKSSMNSSVTPTVSLSATIEGPELSSDDELNGVAGIDVSKRRKKSKSRAKSARLSNLSKSMTFMDGDEDNEQNIIKLTNSMTIQQGANALDSNMNDVKREINTGFDAFSRALKQQQSKLLEDVDAVYDDKKDELVEVERKLFENGKKPSKKEKGYSFDANIQFTLNKPRCLQQIKKFGRVVGTDSADVQRQAASILSQKLHSNTDSVVIHTQTADFGAAGNEDDAKGEALMDDDMDDLDVDGTVMVADGGQDDDALEDDEDEAAVTSVAAKQKLILGEIQQKTMSKLDTVILMEKEAKRKKKQAAELEKEVQEALRYIDERTVIINEKLEAARPELDNAREAVNGIDPKDINEIKTLKSPPKVVENVMTATVMILGHEVKEWKDVKKLLSYRFKPELLNFDTYTLKKSTRQKVYKKYAGKEDFNYERVYEASKACGQLVLWVLSQIKYSRVLDVIIPLEKEVKKLKKDAKRKQKLAKELLSLVHELKENIELYTAQCNEMIDHIIKSTDHELQQFSNKLQPLNEKFYAILNNNVLE
eukprot:CAMPEP_0197025396 /NCGR_PEP_ID=MMETSP1384-20130603/5757_1 /TAXON_ID=29189 /ORGANISM="Ammonia sp." /LENGTH=692 /DNA_ID=CAMNT_0042453923 /DNA_START=52 /DNA_END=2130 /DNA_ORIENTATION=+